MNDDDMIPDTTPESDTPKLDDLSEPDAPALAGADPDADDPDSDEPDTDEPDTSERIAKVMARAGVASRREAERIIVEGRVTVNGQKITSPALDVTPDDKITVDGKPLDAPQPTRLWMYYKPVGLVTTESDEKGRQTVFDALPRDLPRVISVGRLDLNSEGLLLLTNDGELKRRLEMPTTGWLRRYRVRVNGRPTDLTFDPLRRGPTIDGEDFQPMEIRLDSQQGANAWLTVGIREGKNREIRRAMEHVGLQVNRLIRIGYGPFRLTGMQENEVKEVKRRVLRDQLGPLLTGEETPEDKPREFRERGADGPRRGLKPRDGDRPFQRRDGDDRKPFARREDGDRKPYQKRDGDRPFQRRDGDDRKPFARREDGDRKPYQKRDGDRPFQRRDGDDRKPFARREDGDRKPYQKRDGDRPFQRRDGDDRKPFARREDGDRKPYQKRDGDRPFQRRDGDDRKPLARREDGDRKSYQKRDGDRPFQRRDGDDRKPFARREDGDRKPYQKRDGDRPFQRRDGDDRKPFARREDGDRKPYQKRDGDRPFQRRDGDDRKPFARREDGDRKPYQKRDGDKPFARRDGGKPGGKPFGKPGGKPFGKPGGPRGPRPGGPRNS